MTEASVTKFGLSDNLTASIPVWVVNTAYPYPTAAAETNIVSSSADDASGGSGCTLVEVQGLDDDYRILREKVTPNGTTPVTLTTQFFRVDRAFSRAGDAAGNLDVRHGTDILARVTPFDNQTEQALYTVPKFFENGEAIRTARIETLRVGIGKSTGQEWCVLLLYVRDSPDHPFRARKSTVLQLTGASYAVIPLSYSAGPRQVTFSVTPGADIQVVVKTVSKTGLFGTASFDVTLSSNY